MSNQFLQRIIVTLFLAIGTSSYELYDFLLFVQQYDKTLCFDNPNCPKPPFGDFTTHGLWPTNYTTTVTCYGRPFDEAMMRRDVSLMGNLDRSMPNVRTGNNMWLWSHEWEFHGTCVDTIFTQSEYFRWIDKQWMRFDIKLTLQNSWIRPHNYNTYRLSDIQAAIRTVTTKDPFIQCYITTDANNRRIVLLWEVGICYDKIGQFVVDCLRQSSNCLYPNNILFPY